MHHLILSLSLATACAVLPAQTTWTVGDPAVPTIDAALAAASPGDIVLVPPGFYTPFTATKGVTIRGDGLSQIGDPLQPGGTVTCDIPPGQELHLKWLLFVDAPIQVLGGRVTISQCNSSSLNATPLSVADATVHLLGSNLTASNATVLHANGSDLTIAGSTLHVASGPPMIDGILIAEQSRLHVTGTRMMVPPTSAAGPAVSARNGSTAWLSDCHLESHACALENVASTVRTDRCTLVELGSGCSAGTAGPLLGVEQVSTTVGFVPGGTWEPVFCFEPNAFVVLFASQQLDTVSWGPVIEQPTWLDHGQAFSVQVLLTDAAGKAPASVTFPSGTHILNQRIWFLGLAGPGLPMQASPPLGGVL